MDQMQSALGTYFAAWNAWKEQNKSYDFNCFKPMHFGWKVPNENAVSSEFSQLLPFADQGHIVTVNNRKIILLVLKQSVENVPLMQLIQRRPGGMENVGLDHVAFYCSDLEALMDALQNTQIDWKRMNGPAHQWISLHFGADNMEAKIFDRTSPDIAGNELLQAGFKIIN